MAAKRALDFAASSVGLAALSLPMTLIGLAIKIDSAGPVFYRGERVGRGGRIFRMFKFRSMRADGAGKGPDATSIRDDRITRVGRFIRKYKLDELPQLLNVLKGEMSLVGPRPEVKWCVDLYTEEEKAILTMRPGITDRASIRFRNEGEIIAASGYSDANKAYLELIRPEKLRLQLEYVRNWSLGLDLKILFQTFTTLFASRPASESNTIVR
jgi:lipopolysaccharide/colanic/teichoic acid biosynthesis glycosyltransferase